MRTARLIAQRLRADDAPALVRLHRDPAVMATLGGVSPDVEARTRRFVDQMLEHWDCYGYGLYVLRAPTGAFVGRAGLRHLHIAGSDELEIMYALGSEFWGRGLATEIAIRLRALALDELGHASVVAFTLATNRASRRVMEKAGLTYERDIEWAELPHVLYRAVRARTSA